MIDGLLDNLYKPYTDEKDSFEERFIANKRYKHGIKTLIANYPEDPDSDGYGVNVYVTAMPARFYTIEALESKNSIGETKQGFTLTTGSGFDSARLAANIAEALNKGMLGLFETM